MKKICNLKLMLLCVLMILTVGMSFKSETFASENPQVVTGLKQEAAGENFVDVQWDTRVSTEEIQYEVEYSSDGENYTSENISLWSDGAQIGNLTKGNIYYVRVREVMFNTDALDYVYGEWTEPIKIAIAPDNMSKVKQIDAKRNSVTLGWKAVKGADTYVVYKKEKKKWTKIGQTDKLKYTIKTKKNIKNIKITASKKLDENNYIECEEGYIVDSAIRVNPYKKLRNGYNFGYNNGRIEISGLKNIDGVQYRIYNLKNKKIMDKHKKITSYFNIKTKNNSFCKLWIRTYIKLDNGKKVYGPWLKNVYGGKAKGKVKLSNKGNTPVIKYAKVEGANYYEVQIITHGIIADNIYGRLSSETMKIKNTSYILNKYNKDSRLEISVSAVKKVGKKKYYIYLGGAEANLNY